MDIALYFIAPHRLRPVDLDFIKRLSNIVPVVRLCAAAGIAGLPCARAQRAQALAGGSLLSRGAQRSVRNTLCYPCVCQIWKPCSAVRGRVGEHAGDGMSRTCRRGCHECWGPAWWTPVSASAHCAVRHPGRALHDARHAAAHGQPEGVGGARRCRCWPRRTA